MLGKKNESQSKVLDVDASLQGNLNFKDAVNLRINGNFEGKLETKGDLLIGDHAVVKASIIGERITVAGNVTGDITALTEIRLTASAHVVGDIETPSFTMEKGCVFHGMSRMVTEGQTPANGRRAFLTLDEVSRYLSVESHLISQWAENGKLPGLREGSHWRFEKEKVDQWIANGRIT
jgi:excisionase family DNA binding protein